jgi:hypothetical protein
MNALSEYWNLGLGALFLKEETYQKMREEANPIVKGLILILLVAVVVALAATVGKVLEWSTTPDLSNLRNIILQELQKMPWYTQMSREPRAIQTFQQIWDSVWQFVTPMIGVNVAGAILGIITNPIVLTLRWLIYGAVAFVFARMLGGKGNLAQTLGCTALAVAPQILAVVQFFPYVQLGGLAVWGLVCSYVGIKTAQQLTPWRAFWATVLPLVLLAFLAILVGCIAGFAAGSLMGAIGGQR